MTTYHTEGIVKDIHLQQSDGSFTLEAEKPYAIEEKNGDQNEKAILFVADGEDAKISASAPVNATPTAGAADSNTAGQTEEDNKTAKADSKISYPRAAFLVPTDSWFEFSYGENQPIDTATLLLLKQNRSKVRIVVDGRKFPKADGNKKFAVSEIDIK